MVPGIDFTDDPLLQGRNFSYPDTQLKRLGSRRQFYVSQTAVERTSPTRSPSS
nr:catalase [Trebonia kvetii]